MNPAEFSGRDLVGSFNVFLTKTVTSFYLGQASQILCLPVLFSLEFQFPFAVQESTVISGSDFSWFHVLGCTSPWVSDYD